MLLFMGIYYGWVLGFVYKWFIKNCYWILGLLYIYVDDIIVYCIGEKMDMVIVLLNKVLDEICKLCLGNWFIFIKGKNEVMLISKGFFCWFLFFVR